MHKVFVYGSLLSGMGNHRLLENSKKLGVTRSPKGFKMVDLGPFPGVVQSEDESKSVYGEVYEVNDETFQRLDRLEGYNRFSPKSGLYDRMEIETKFGRAYIYIYNGHSARVVENGDWRAYHTKKGSL